jgi:hypothetical protein
MMDILRACDDPHLFAPWFKRGDWTAWRAFLAALFGLPIGDEALALYRHHTGRKLAPLAPQDEAWLIIGRRGGKSFVMALVAVYLAAFRDYRAHLQPGERATVMVIAADRRQARVIMRYIKGLLREVPMLAARITGETAEGVDLTNQVSIEVGTASFRTTRGYSFAAVLGDEIAFWPTDDAAEPDHAILDAVRPGMASIPGSMLICASSPYARRGALYEAHKRHWGKDGDPLVWKATTREMNPTIPQTVIDRAMARDASSASAEYLAEFRRDIEAFMTLEVIQACVSEGITERPPEAGIQYRAFVDPSGGSSDSMTLAIGHTEGEMAVLDALRERRPPFSPESVVDEFCATLKAYGISQVTGDRYGGEWPREQFRKRGVAYQLSDHTRSEIYLDLLPVLNSQRADLLDSPRVVTQLATLERRVARGGREIIDHAPGGHDDLANAAAGLIGLCRAKPKAPAALFGVQANATRASRTFEGFYSPR